MIKVTQEKGIAALQSGDFATAVSCFQAAGEVEPGNAVIPYNLAQALDASGRPGEAIIQATNALARDRALHPAARLLTRLLSHFRLRNPCSIDPAGLCAAFGFIDVDHQVLGPTALTYLKQCTALGDALFLGGTKGWNSGARWLLSSKGKAVLRDPLLRTALCAAANTDLDIECLLTAVRKALLMSSPKDTLRKAHILEFACVLVSQGEINEYVFAVSGEEQNRLDGMFINMQGLRDGSRAAADSLLLKALYYPLWHLLGENARDIDGRQIKPKALGDLINTQMAERAADVETAQKIEALGTIGDETSRNVARLYEESPYPRWLSLQTPVEGGHRDQLSQYFPENDLTFMDTPFKVLIAGSGTGQQATDAAIGYGPKAAITAIDISLASLAYAKRMAGRFGVENLHFMQCDILNASLLEDTFDIIECVGVLHHMGDPWDGWKVLGERLRAGGLMKIGLYSRAARRTIASLRDDIQVRNSCGDEPSIRAYRQDIIAQGDRGKGAFLRQSADFYTLGNFRDLMFHVSEQHLAIPDIADFMATNGLTFQGFQVPLDIDEGAPDGEGLRDLGRWHEFECVHKDTFKGMYVFWCRKE